jgi:hypothetical protein
MRLTISTPIPSISSATSPTSAVWIPAQIWIWSAAASSADPCGLADGLSGGVKSGEDAARGGDRHPAAVRAHSAADLGQAGRQRADDAVLVAGSWHVETLGGLSSVFERIVDTVKTGGADDYRLANVLHDWDDARAIEILHNCHAAMSGAGRVLMPNA